MSSVRLTYSHGRGLGEGIRMLLAACGIEFTDNYLEEREDFLKVDQDGKLLFHQVPLLEIDGLNLIQYRAIVRYIAKREGFYGSNNVEEAQIDMLFEGARDFHNYFLLIGFSDTKKLLDTGKSKALPRYLPIFDQALKKNGTGFLVGGKMSLADVALLEVLLTVVENFGDDVITDYPSLKAFKSKMTSEERIKAFLNGPQRNKPNDEAYANQVRKILLLDF